jgi:hypothetical protein
VSDRKLVQAREAFSGFINGALVVVGPGDVFYDDDPIVKGSPKCFADIAVRESTAAPMAPPPVPSVEPAPPVPPASETASANPNQPRRLGRASKPDNKES